MLTLVGCSSTESDEIDTSLRDFCKTVEQAYDEGKSGDMFSKEKPVKSTVDIINVSDDIIIWVAEKEDDNLLCVPMAKNKSGYYFNGRETTYYIPDISDECEEEDFWPRHPLANKKTVKFTVFKGNSYSGSGTSVKLKVQGKDYMLVYKNIK